MSKILDIVFNQFYVWACRYNFANTPQLSAMYMLGLILFSNLITFICFIGMPLGFFIFNSFGDHIIVAVIIGLTITTLPIYLIYIKSKRYLDLCKDYEQKSPQKKRKFKYFTIAFIIISVVLFLVSALISGMYARGVLNFIKV